MQGVKQIGRRSLSSFGSFSLGIGVMFAHFQVSGTIPEDKERLKRSEIGSASS